MKSVLIHAADEYTRETLKSALINRLPLIVTEDRDQCLEAAGQKAAASIAFIAACNADDEPDLELFEEINSLRPEMKLIAVGDHDTETAAAEAVRRGASGYIVLPAEPNAILALAQK